MRERLRLFRTPRRDTGLSLVELLVTVIIFGVVGSAFVLILLRTTGLSFTNRGRVVAANLAAQRLEVFRHVNSGNAQVGRTSETVVAAGTSYQVVSDLRWVKKASSRGPCDDAATGGSLAYIRADVTVTWPGMGTTRPVTSSTVILPDDVPNTTPGAAGVKVTTRAGVPAGGHVVTLVFPNATQKKQTTDADGCAYFPFLPVGSYTASLNTTGYVDAGGYARPSRGMAVATGSAIPLWQLVYDRATP